MPRVRRSRRKIFAKGCARIGCEYFAVPGQNKCSSCAAGRPVVNRHEQLLKCIRYKQKVERLVRSLCVSDSEYAEMMEGVETPIQFLSKVRAMENGRNQMYLPKVMFTAKQVLPLMSNYDCCSAWHLIHQKEATISLQDKILGRVLDYWNLGLDEFPGVLRCYWGHHGDYVNPVEFYMAREKLLHANGNGTGIMHPLLYMARRGDEPVGPFAKLYVSMILRKFKEL